MKKLLLNEASVGDLLIKKLEEHRMQSICNVIVQTSSQEVQYSVQRLRKLATLLKRSFNCLHKLTDSFKCFN
ncbi:hypothetical protein KHA80_21250 [Anaerobacillus sp. HL2]|nr:hypothetical protein KHA80_21250 [Anaerobacillus sp. HL2]